VATLCVFAAVLVLSTLWLRPLDPPSKVAPRQDPVGSNRADPLTPAAATRRPATPVAPSDHERSGVGPEQRELRVPADRRKLLVRVTDPHEVPVAGAYVRLTTFTPKSSRSSFPWRGEAVHGRTDWFGMLPLEYPARGVGSGGQPIELGEVSLLVEHRTYPSRSCRARVDDTELHVILELGSVVIVSGWIDDPSERVLDVRPLLEDRIRVNRADWVPIGDGRLSCNRIPPGPHEVVLLAELDGASYSSAATELELAPGAREELHLRLFPPRVLEGRFEDCVPRPVLNGQVEAAWTGVGSTGAILRTFSAAVGEDGSFRLDGLPQEEIEIIGLCDGWSSRTSPVPGDPILRRVPTVSAEHEGAFVLPMETTAYLEATVLDPEGTPLADALVQVNPNVNWRGGFSELFALSNKFTELERRGWIVTTDSSGRASLANIPPQENLWVLVKHPHFQMPRTTSPRGTVGPGEWVACEPGKTTALEVVLEDRVPR